MSPFSAPQAPSPAPWPRPLTRGGTAPPTAANGSQRLPTAPNGRGARAMPRAALVTVRHGPARTRGLRRNGAARLQGLRGAGAGLARSVAPPSPGPRAAEGGPVPARLPPKGRRAEAVRQDAAPQARSPAVSVRCRRAERSRCGTARSGALALALYV